MAWGRTILLSFGVLAAGGLVGCIGNADEALDSASTDAEQASNASNTVENATSPTREPVDVTRTHELFGSTNASTQTFQIPPNLGPYGLQMVFEPSTVPMTCTMTDAEIVLETPDGETFENLSAGTNVLSVGDPCDNLTKDGVQMSPGEWTVTFDGFGTSEGILQVAN